MNNVYRLYFTRMNVAIQVVFVIRKLTPCIDCQHLCFKQEDQSVKMNEQRTGGGAQ